MSDPSLIPVGDPEIDPRYDPAVGRVFPTFVRYAVPSVLGMLAVSSAGIIDGFFIGNFVGATALAAVNIAQPFWAVFAAIVYMLAVGGSVTSGRHLGAKDTDAASGIFTRTVIATGVSALLITVCGLLFLDQLVRLLGANAELAPLVSSYMRIILWFAPLLIVGLTLDYFVRVDGRPVLASAGLITFSGTNIVLNALFVGYLGWGIEGAAWASGLADVAMLAVLATHWLGGRATLRLTLRLGRWRDVLGAAWNGFSEFTNELSIGFLVLLFNWVMITRLGVEGVAAYTVVSYLVMVALFIAYGISETLQPTISRCLGAGKPKRIKRFLRIAMASAFLVGLTVSLLLLTVPEAMIGVFLDDTAQETMLITLTFISLFWPAFLFNGMNICLTSYFTALHRPVPSAIIAITRSLLLPGLGLLLLPRWFGDKGVYMVIPIAEVITFVLALTLAWRLGLPKTLPVPTKDPLSPSA